MRYPSFHNGVIQQGLITTLQVLCVPAMLARITTCCEVSWTLFKSSCRLWMLETRLLLTVVTCGRRPCLGSRTCGHQLTQVFNRSPTPPPPPPTNPFLDSQNQTPKQHKTRHEGKGMDRKERGNPFFSPCPINKNLAPASTSLAPLPGGGGGQREIRDAKPLKQVSPCKTPSFPPANNSQPPVKKRRKKGRGGSKKKHKTETQPRRRPMTGGVSSMQLWEMRSFESWCSEEKSGSFTSSLWLRLISMMPHRPTNQVTRLPQKSSGDPWAQQIHSRRPEA